MIEQQAQVVSVTEGRAAVRLGARSGCSACDAGRGCGAGLFGRLLKRRPVVLELENTVGARAGEPVIVGLPEQVFLRLAARFYLWPLLLALAGAALGHFLATELLASGPGLTDALTLAGGLLAAVAAFLRLRATAPEFPASSAVHVMRVVGNSDSKS